MRTSVRHLSKKIYVHGPAQQELRAKSRLKGAGAYGPYTRICEWGPVLRDLRKGILREPRKGFV